MVNDIEKRNQKASESFYKDWIVEKWETPFQKDRSYLTLEYFLALSDMHLILRSKSFTYWIKFRGTCPYRCLYEGHRLGLWELLHEHYKYEPDSSWIVRKSDFLDFVDEKGLFYHGKYENKMAYMITTSGDCIEIVTNAVPEIQVFENRDPNELIAEIVKKELETPHYS